jgi:hypothetical protein
MDISHDGPLNIYQRENNVLTENCIDYIFYKPYYCHVQVAVFSLLNKKRAYATEFVCISYFLWKGRIYIINWRSVLCVLVMSLTEACIA